MENSDTSVIWRMMTNCRKEVDYKVAMAINSQPNNKWVCLDFFFYPKLLQIET